MKMLKMKQLVALGLSAAAATAGGGSAASVAAKQATTTIRFTVSEKGRDKLSKGQVLITRASGSGTLTLADTPQARAVNQSTSATGTIHFHGWRVVGNRVVDDA